ncbi:MAG: creatininase family protein [Candidatus Latescibacterota bacterium]
MSVLFADQTWPQLERAVQENRLILLPVGQVEEHGRHLPVSTDAAIASAVGRSLAESLVEHGVPTLVMPTLWTGYSTKEMARWPGTMRVRPQVLTDLLFDVCMSLVEMGFRKIILLNCHGHHTGILRVVVRRISDECDVYMAMFSPATLSAAAYNEVRQSERGGSIHGGEWETALMLHLGEPVDMSQVTDEDAMRYHSDFVAGDNFTGSQKVFWSTWGIQKSRTGIYGDPTQATAETGQKIMEAILKEGAAFAREYATVSDRASET